LFAAPWALPHLPEPPRFWQRPTAAAPPPAPSLDWPLDGYGRRVMAACALRDPEARLRHLAEHYRELAAWPDAELSRTLEHDHLSRQTRLLGGYLEALDEGRATGAHWRQDVQALSEAAQRAISQSPAFSSAWLAEFRAISGDYAAALARWPQLRQAWPELEMACAGARSP
ncbi:MAG: hypothetical protein R6X17_06445, partial [Candidatus Competibacteraceae bacterium]